MQPLPAYKKSQKNVSGPSATYAPFNNTIITITDRQERLPCRGRRRGGTGFKGSRRVDAVYPLRLLPKPLARWPWNGVEKHQKCRSKAPVPGRERRAR